MPGLAIGSNGMLDGFTLHTWREAYHIPGKISSSPYFETSSNLGVVGAWSAGGALTLGTASY